MTHSSNTSEPFGKRLLPQVVDHLASSQPDRVFGKYIVNDDLSGGFMDMTMSNLATGVNHVAWWIAQNLGTSSSFETVAYLGIADFRYTIVILAAIKCGFKVAFPLLLESLCL